MCDKTFWNIMRRYKQEKSSMLAGCATRHFETSGGDTHRRKALCLQDVRQDILKHHEKIHTREKPYACRSCNETFWNIGKDTQRRKAIFLKDVSQDFPKCHKKINIGEKSTGCATRNPEMSSEETHRRKAYRMCDEIFVDRTDQKRQEKMCRGEKPFVCGKCNESFFYQTDQKCQAKIHTGEKPFACRMCDEKFWNVMWRYTQEKSLQDVRWDLCQSDRPEMSWENVHRTKTICMWDVQRGLCKLDLPQMSCEDTRRRKALCLHDVRHDILKHHEKIHTGKKICLLF